ncbi:TPA: DUF89 family protein [Candidatus Bathyarchaeota archaeon]|nr:DUF89 family protein [Candidatus Bathyarchaeota archaeon]
MKVDPECASCLLHRGYLEIARATSDEALQFKAVQALLRMIATDFGPHAVPAYLGTERDRLIRRITGNPDPYLDARRRANELALRSLPVARRFVESSRDGRERLRRLCLVSIVANTIELDVIGHEFDLASLSRMFEQERLVLDHTDRLHDKLLSCKKVLFLADNAGEIALDTLLVAGIKELGPSVTVVVKGKPVIDDALLDDALQVGMDEVADRLITTGTDTVGLIIREASPELIEELMSCDLVVAKGMGNYETLTEERIGRPIAYLLRAKCNPVARSIGVAKESNVAILL